MHIPRIYHPETLQPERTYPLSSDASQHLLKVLRLTVNDQLILFDGTGVSCQAVISEISKKQVIVTTLGSAQQQELPGLHIHLGLSISKGDRMDYAIQKSVEAGALTITPLISERTIVKLDEQRVSKRNDHWQGIIINACEQCGQNRLPLLNPVTPLSIWASEETEEFRICFDASADATLTSLSYHPHVRIVIGPEGGLSEDELSLLKKSGFAAVRMGPRVLRTETAAVSACVALQTLWGDYAS
jgi:16S rRNA (uracil1498-N3)-methyltransferase